MHDPTRTLTLRNKTISEINRRYSELKGLINVSIVKNRVFHTNAEPLPPNAFSGLNPGQSLAAWNNWLFQTVNEVILDVPRLTPLTLTPSFQFLQSQWLITPILEGYRRGVVTENKALKRLVPSFGTTTVAAPRHLVASQIIASRDYTALKGITQTMSDQMTQVLTQGIIEGDGAAELARKINNRVDKIGVTRSRLLARTEIVFANNLAGINEDVIFEEITGETIVERWLTSGLENVRDSHILRNNRLYTKERALELIGEPNCVCDLVAVLKSEVPSNRKILS